MTATTTPAGAALRAVSLQNSLTVRDLEKSSAWYTDVLGCTVDRRMERDGKLVAVGLRAGSVTLLLNQDDGAKGWDRVVGQGFSMFFTLDGGIDALAEGIKARGGTLDLEPTDMPWGSRFMRIFDLDGYKIGIGQPIAK
ncbi:MAG: VOC family protein [Gemmatimonadales bacterium]